MSYKVAVLISVYLKDSVSSFKEAVSSIINQDLCYDINIYLGIDGEITDNLKSYISNNKSLFHKIIKSDSNVGLACILNLLIETISDEKYVFRMDSDDFSYPNRFSTQTSFLDSNNDVDVCGSFINEVYIDSNLCSKKEYPTSHENIKNHIHKASPFAHPTVCFRASLFSCGLRYSNRYHLNEDIDLWFTLLLNDYRLSNVPYVLLDFYIPANFYKRRGFIKSYNEFLCYISGIYRLHGLTLRLIFPFFRLIFRLLPSSIVRTIYTSENRKSFLK